MTVPSATVSAWSIIVRQRSLNDSLNSTSKVNGLPPWLSGRPTSSAVSAAPGPATVAVTAPESIAPAPVHTAPAAAQSVVPGSVTVTSPAPDGVTVSSHSRFGCRPRYSRCALSRRRACVTCPFVTSNASSRITRSPIANASL